MPTIKEFDKVREENKRDTIEKLEALKKEILYHMNRYYNDDEPEISDYEYDKLMQRLKSIENSNPELITPDSPTQIIGGKAKREAGVKITHNVPMLSIEDVFTKEDVASWFKKVKEKYPDAEFSVETKIDGLSMTLRYEKTSENKMSLKLAETRGDGIVGEDVTANALVIKDVPKTINLPYEYLELRGEVYMTFENFDKYNVEQELRGEPVSANPRNLAAGTLRQLDSSIVKKRGLNMFIFNVQDGPKELVESHIDSLKVLKSCGFKTVKAFKCKTEEEILEAIDKIAELKKDFDFSIDGAVVKLNQINYRKAFPAGTKYSAGHIAYKYPPEEKETVLRNIELTVGRTGKVVPVAVFDPIELCGTTVSRATLHNRYFIDALGIGIGAKIKVYKSGEIIPKVKCVSEAPEEVFRFPDTCPVCGSKLVTEGDMADTMCINPLCPAQVKRSITYFVSRDCMNIMGLSDAYIDALIKNGFLRYYSDIYQLKNHREELIEKGILGKDKNTDKILKEIEKSKSNEAYSLLAGLGIKNIGKTSAKNIMRHFKSIGKIKEETEESLSKIEGIGPITAKAIYDFFHTKETLDVFDALIASGVNDKAKETKTGSAFSGKTFVITGTLPTMSRNDATNFIEENGGKCSSSVSKNTDFLLAGEAAGSKLEKAKSLGIKIISEDDLKSMVS